MARRVLVAEFMHETNTFSVQLTDEQAFRNSSYYIDDDIRPAFEGTQDLARRSFRGGAPVRMASRASAGRIR